MYECGQIFTVDERDFITGDMDEEFILAQIFPNTMILISLQDGNRWNDPQTVDDIYNITEDEMKLITKNRKYTRIKMGTFESYEEVARISKKSKWTENFTPSTQLLNKELKDE